MTICRWKAQFCTMVVAQTRERENGVEVAEPSIRVFRVLRRFSRRRVRYKILFGHCSANQARCRLFATFERTDTNARCRDQAASKLPSFSRAQCRLTLSVRQGRIERARALPAGIVHWNHRRCAREYAIAYRIAENHSRQVRSRRMRLDNTERRPPL